MPTDFQYFFMNNKPCIDHFERYKKIIPHLKRGNKISIQVFTVVIFNLITTKRRQITENLFNLFVAIINYNESNKIIFSTRQPDLKCYEKAHSSVFRFLVDNLSADRKELNAHYWYNLFVFRMVFNCIRFHYTY